MLKIVRDWILNSGLELTTANIIARCLIFVFILITSIIAYIFAKHFILKALVAVIGKTATQWDDMVLKK